MGKKLITYILKKIDLLVTSVLSPEVFCILLPIILGTCYHRSIIDTITDTQAKILLQKEHLDPLQHRITETWIATSALLFLLNEYSKPGSNKSQKINSDSIRSAYNYWKQITDNWKSKWKSKFDNNLADIKIDKRHLHKQFKDIVSYFELEFFNKLRTCYNNYYSKGESCITPTRTLPLPANVTEFQNKIYSFYIEKSKKK